MALPNISTQVSETNLGAFGSGVNKALIIGPASGGSKADTLYTFGSIQQIKNTIGYGPAQIQAELIMGMAPSGFSQVDCVVANASTTGSITQLVTGSAGQDINLSAIGATLPQEFQIIVEVTTAGGYGEGKFRYSLDGGYSWANNNTITSSVVFPDTGVSCSFENTIHSVGNSAVFFVQSDKMTGADLTAALNFAASGSNTNYTWIIVAEDNRVPTATLFDAADAALTSWNNTYFKHTQLILPVGGETKNLTDYTEFSGAPDTDAVLTVIKDKVASTGNFISTVAERARVFLPQPSPGFTAPSLPFSYVVAGECQGVGSDISLNPAQNPVRRVVGVSYNEFLDGSVYHDEGIIAPRTFIGEAGYFMNQALLKTTSTSSWDIVPKARITSIARSLLRSVMRRYLNSRLRVLTDGTGRIDPRDKARIEAEVSKFLRAAFITPITGAGFPGHVSGLEFSINGENNLLLTKELEGSLNIVPLAYPTSIQLTIALVDSINVEPVQ